MLLRVRLPDGQTVRVTAECSEQELLHELEAKILSLDKVSVPFSLHRDVSLRTPIDGRQIKNGDIVFVKGTPKMDANDEETAENHSHTSFPVPEAVANASVGQGTNEDKSLEESAWQPRCMHGPNGMCEHCMPKEDKKSRYERELAKWKGRGMSVSVMEALDALKVRIKPQESAHIAAAVVDNDAASEFQAYLAKLSFSQQRIGICYGNYDAEQRQTFVSAIYEPPQRGSADTYDQIEGDEAGDISKRAEKLAHLLGMSCVGIVISARPRKCILSAKDVVFVARLLCDMPPSARKAFVVLLVSETESGETAFEAYQLSDQAVEIFRDGILASFEEQKANAGRVTTTEDVLVEGKETRRVHTEFFLMNVPIKPSSGLLRTSFPVENRDLTPQGPADIRKAVSDSSELPYGKRVADFHLLLFLSSFFDMDTDMPGLAGSVQVGSDSIEEGYRLMIDSIASSS